MALTYNPAIFDTASLDEARRIILTPDGSSTARRWETETPYVADLIGQSLDLRAEMTVLDFGCGIGRIAKVLIDRHRCRIIGVDISAKMRAMAAEYVASDRFVACSPAMLETMVCCGLRFDAALAIWVLQHSINLTRDIETIREALQPDAAIFVLNNLNRAVPTKELSWVDDQVDVKNTLNSVLALRREGLLPPDKIAPDLALLHFWAVFMNRAR